MDDFKEKRVVITGGSDGIGRELAVHLDVLGGEVMVVGRRAAEQVDLPEACHYVSADLAQPDSYDIIMGALEALGWDGVDYLVLNASIGYVGPIGEQDKDALNRLIHVNLKSPLALSQLFFPKLKERNGSVLFVGSTLSRRATPDFAVYTATKTALRDVAKNLAVEWGDRVRVQLVEPGPTRTAFHAKSGMDKPPLVLLFMKPDEVARGIVRALSTGRSYVRYSMVSLLFYAVKRMFAGLVS